MYAYSFPIAAVRNDHRLSNLNNTDILSYSSRSQKSSTSQQGSIPSGGSRGESVPLLFLASNLTANITLTSTFFHHISFSDSDHPPPSSKGPFDYIEATQIIEGYLTISGPLT